MSHEQNFFATASPLPHEPKLGDPPPYVFAWRESPEALEQRAAEEANREPVINGFGIKDKLNGSSTSTLWALADPWESAVIEMRPWIARGYLMRGSVTVVSGPGSAGKSSLMVAWAAALALGCAFHRMKPTAEFRVATYNVEDDQDEQKRRFSALLSRLELCPKAFAGRLAILGSTGVGTLLHTDRNGALLVNTPIMDELEAYVAAFKPDILMLDPFVELHEVEENDNTAVRAVMARLRAMAVEHNMAVVILHHARKGAGEPGEMDSLRGASSIVGAARVVLTVNSMTTQEAEAFGMAPEKRRNFFRLDGAKNNYAPIEEAEWFERVEVQLDNGGPNGAGDLVAAAWPWHPPKLWSSIPSPEVNRVMDIIAEGPAPGIRFSPSKRGKHNGRWVGVPVVDTLGVNAEQAGAMVAAWLKSGLLTCGLYHDAEQRREKTGIFVDDSRRPT